MNKYFDIEIECECGALFVWTGGEQNFINKLFEEGKIKEVNQPKRCPLCKEKKKKRMEKFDRK